MDLDALSGAQRAAGELGGVHMSRHVQVPLPAAPLAPPTWFDES